MTFLNGVNQAANQIAIEHVHRGNGYAFAATARESIVRFLMPLVDVQIQLLQECRERLVAGIETPGECEPEWSVADRELVTRIDRVLAEQKG